MLYLLFDEPLYFQLNGSRQQLPRPQALRLLESHARHALAAFLDYEVKVIPAPDGNPTQKERMIAACFPANTIIQAERIGPNQFMVIGSDKQRVNAVYEALLPMKLEQLVPYGLGVRAYLNNLNFLSPDTITLCVDNLKTYVLMTIFEGNRFSSTRRIVIADEGQLISELKRSLQAYLSDNPASREKSLNVITNQMDWLSALGAYFSKENVKVFDSLCPCLDGLAMAKFSMHFRSLEEILRQKRHQVMVDRIRIWVAGGVIILTGLGAYALAWGYNQRQSEQLFKAKARLEDMQGRLRQMNNTKIFALLKKKGVINYSFLFNEFLRGMPVGYLLKNWSINSDQGEGSWELKAEIYPQSNYVASRTFCLTGLFQQAKLEAAVVNKVLGQVITLKINGEVL
jgi:hypothetical protein